MYIVGGKIWMNTEYFNKDTLSILQDVKAESEQINLKVVGQDGSVVHFKIKKHTPFRKLMTTYCDRAGLNIQNVRFRFDGQPISELDTPSGLEMEDEDTIDVFQQQTGGILLNIKE
ncbi:small ubiquitin-related modifier 3-like [Centruroides sculpturatus]|uniref:small ubiquitin-related modifier 3-like n=1 Tax=Centruroides sculpturatus TaxID=218467 RepID=UPI000C6E9181|nr:small ubiquitin-related modifier 3-like [Centruroides sculpturatus]